MIGLRYKKNPVVGGLLSIIIIIIIDGLFTLLSQIRFELQSVYKFNKVKKKKYFTLNIRVYKKAC